MGTRLARGALTFTQLRSNSVPVGPSHPKETRPFGRYLLLLRFLKHFTLTSPWIVFLILKLALYLLLILTREIDRVGLGRFQLDEVVL